MVSPFLQLLVRFFLFIERKKRKIQNGLICEGIFNLNILFEHTCLPGLLVSKEYELAGSSHWQGTGIIKFACVLFNGEGVDGACTDESLTKTEQSRNQAEPLCGQKTKSREKNTNESRPCYSCSSKRSFCLDHGSTPLESEETPPKVKGVLYIYILFFYYLAVSLSVPICVIIMIIFSWFVPFGSLF